MVSKKWDDGELKLTCGRGQDCELVETRDRGDGGCDGE